MARGELLFENYSEFERFRQRELVAVYPEQCQNCTFVKLETLDIANAVDNRLTSSDTARQQAKEQAENIGRRCVYGYSKEHGCSIDVVCRLG